MVEGLKGSGSNAAAAFSFGKYQLFASLGRGGMADVFLAVSRGPMGFNKLVVIKRLRPALAEEATFRQMFLDEARLAARLNHPNVVHTYEVGEHEGVYFIAMEYLDGQSLNKVVKEASKRGERLDPRFCARMIADALSGLHHAHELKDYDGRPLDIIHRDISPHNIFATYDGHVKLVDFGIAKAALSSTETEVGVLKGKVAYMAPEQASGGKIDARADVFAMGIVLWELLTQQRLMTGDSAAVTLHRLLHQPIPKVATLVPDIDPRLEAVVTKALEKEPDDRFQSAVEMRDALEAFLHASGEHVKQDDVGRMLNRMFSHVREDVQRQIQAHMALVSSAQSTGELQALTADALQRMEQNGTKLLKLGGSGSGSGVVSTPPPAPEVSNPSMPPPPATSGSAPHLVRHSSAPAGPFAAANPPTQGTGGRVALLIVSVVLVLGLMIALALLLRPHKTSPVAVDHAESTTNMPVSAVTPTMSAVPQVSSVGVPAPTESVALTPSTTTGGRKSAPPHTGQHTKPPPPPPPQADPPSEEQGFLTLQTYPFTRVSEGGKSLGTTPLVKLPLAPGAHVLLLENSDQGIKQSYTVTIKSGDTFTRSLDLKLGQK